MDKTPTLSINKRGRAVRLCWTHKRQTFRVSLGLDPSEKEIEYKAAEIRLALIGGNWPAWALESPAVGRYRRALSSVGEVGPGEAISDDTVLAVYKSHLLATRSEGSALEWLARIKELAAWSPVPLVELKKPDCMDFLDWIRSTPHVSARAARVLAVINPGEVIGAQELHARMVAAAFADSGQKEYERVRRVLMERPDLFQRIARGQYMRKKKPDPRPGRAMATRNKALSQGLVFGEFMVARSWWDANFFEGLGFPAADLPEEIRFLSPDEVAQVLNAADSLGHGDPVRLALFEGLRRGEIARLQKGDIFVDRGVLSIGRHKATKTKTGKARVVPIFDSARDTIRRLVLSKNRRVVGWPAEKTKWEYVAELLVKQLRGACPELDPQAVGFNAWRHTFCTNLAATGKITIDQLAAISGHTPKVCRTHYAHLCPDVVVDRLSGLL